MEEPRLVSLTEAACFLQCHPRTVRRRIDDGTITGYRFGPRLIRVDLNELARQQVLQQTRVNPQLEEMSTRSPKPPNMDSADYERWVWSDKRLDALREAYRKAAGRADCGVRIKEDPVAQTIESNFDQTVPPGCVSSSTRDEDIEDHADSKIWSYDEHQRYLHNTDSDEHADKMREITEARKYLDKIRESKPTGRLLNALDDVAKELDTEEQHLRGLS